MIRKTKGKLFIGTSNVLLPGNKKHFPPAFQQSSRLHYYGSLFNSVEINSSFYKLPLLKTFGRWASEVPEDFQFSFKLSKEITHVRSLKSDPLLLEKFLNNAVGLGRKSGPLLIQFPGKITFDFYNEVEAMLEGISKHDKESYFKIAVEFRHPSWYVAEVNEMLDYHGASLVLHDIPASRNLEANKMAAFIYQRFHGVSGDYRGSYELEDLDVYAGKVRRWLAVGKDVYVYFNNSLGSAFENASYLSGQFSRE